MTKKKLKKQHKKELKEMEELYRGVLEEDTYELTEAINALRIENEILKKSLKSAKDALTYKSHVICYLESKNE